MGQEQTGRGTWTHECQDCRSPLIQPSEWTRRESAWLVRLRCPECGAEYDANLDQDQVTDLSYAMEDGFHTILQELEELDRAQFHDECDVFLAALKAGSIFPMDF